VAEPAKAAASTPSAIAIANAAETAASSTAAAIATA